MTQNVKWINKDNAPSFLKRWKPLLKILSKLSPLKSRGNRPLKIDFEHQLKALVFFHFEEHTSASHLIQVLKEDDFASEQIAPSDGIEKSSFSEANNTRGLAQFLEVFQELYVSAHRSVP